MTIYTLAIYSCVTLMSPLSQDLLSKTCAWNGNTLYTTIEKCEADAPKDGSPIFSDIADGRKVEKHSCNPIGVR